MLFSGVHTLCTAASPERDCGGAGNCQSKHNRRSYYCTSCLLCRCGIFSCEATVFVCYRDAWVHPHYPARCTLSAQLRHQSAAAVALAIAGVSTTEVVFTTLDIVAAKHSWLCPPVQCYLHGADRRERVSQTAALRPVAASGAAAYELAGYARKQFTGTTPATGAPSRCANPARSGRRARSATRRSACSVMKETFLCAVCAAPCGASRARTAKALHAICAMSLRARCAVVFAPRMRLLCRARWRRTSS